MADEHNFKRVDPKRLEALVEQLFARAGVPADDAALEARALVDADLRGVYTHGCRAVPRYLREIRAGTSNPLPTAKTIRDDGATVVLDAEFGLGHANAYRAMELAIERAKRFGIGAVAVRKVSHVGAVAYYSQMAADAGCIGYATTNGGISVIPPGGREKVCGLNPLSWAVPTSRPWSINLDMSTSVVAGGKLAVAKARGEKIPLGWAVDPDGNPTTDPDLGMKGGILPVGGPKGYGLSVVLDVLSGVLSGGRFGVKLGEPANGAFLQAIDVEHFMPLAEFKARVDALVDQLKGSAPAPGSAGVFLPGEIEYNCKLEYLAEGIPMDDPALDELGAEAARAELPFDIVIN